MYQRRQYREREFNHLPVYGLSGRMESSETLVLGTAFHYQVHEVRAFVESLRRYYDGQAILLVSSRNPDLIQYLHARRIGTVFFDCPYWMHIHVQLARYVRYGELLRPLGKTYERLLLTDVSDVIFQAHPFDQAPDGEMLCFLEPNGRLIGHDPSNCQWIEQVFGPQVLERLKDKPISCSGTTIGTQEAIMQYIELLLNHANPKKLDQYRSYRGHDQGIHNFLLHTGALPGAKLIRNGEHVFTIGFVPENQMTVAPDGAILDCEGRKAAIVHQYNYHPAILRHVQSLYPDGRQT